MPYPALVVIAITMLAACCFFLFWPTQSKSTPCNVDCCCCGPEPQARTILEKMQAKKQKEATKLEKRIDLVSHLSALVYGKIKEMKSHELALHLEHCDNSDVKLPFDLRCQYLQRRAEDLMASLQESNKKSVAQSIVDAIVRCFAVWSPMKAKSEAEMTAWQVWSDEKQRLVKQAQDGTIADEELESLTEKQGQAVSRCVRHDVMF